MTWFRADCKECDEFDASTKFLLYAERDKLAKRHEHHTGHTVERSSERRAENTGEAER